MKQILVVVDMQNDFIDGALGSPQAQAIVEPAAAKLKDWTGLIFVTLDTHGDDYLKTAEGKALPVKHCVRRSRGWQLNPKIIEQVGCRPHETVMKPTFGSVELAQLIGERTGGGADVNIQIIGLCTDICVVSNALLLKSFFPEAQIQVDASCCAGTSLEAHNMALATMRSCQIEIIGE